MPWTVYRWDDAGAPTLTGQAGTYDLINLLDKCLVTGYGAKPAAGWTKPYTGTGKAAFRQGAGSNGRYLRVDCSSSGQYPRLRSYDTMSDVDTGTNPMPTDAQVSGGAYAHTSNTTDATARGWMVFADSKRFYLLVGATVSAATFISDNATARPQFFFGDLETRVPGDAYNTMLIAGSVNNPSSTQHFGLLNSGTGFSASAGHYLAGTFAQVSGSTPCCKRPSGLSFESPTVIGTNTGGNFATAYPDPMTTGMRVGKLMVYESASGYRGTLPGVYCPMHQAPAALGDTLSGTATGGLSGKSFILLHVGANASSLGRALFETSDTVG